MAKRKLKEIAEDFKISFEDAQSLVTLHLEEEMVTGRGKNTWINDEGQEILDGCIPMNKLYRSRVIQECNNKKFVYAYIKELATKVPVRIPNRYQGRVLGKFIHIEAEEHGNETKYFYKPSNLI
tara:strand:- start:414 stop:785 length:372 start_codon:yes stop_codon:yes gene_type:complete